MRHGASTPCARLPGNGRVRGLPRPNPRVLHEPAEHLAALVRSYSDGKLNVNGQDQPGP